MLIAESLGKQVYDGIRARISTENERCPEDDEASDVPWAAGSWYWGAKFAEHSGSLSISNILHCCLYNDFFSLCHCMHITCFIQEVEEFVPCCNNKSSDLLRSIA